MVKLNVGDVIDSSKAKFSIKEAKKVCVGLFAVTDSIVEHYESRAVKMFPIAIDRVEELEVALIEERAKQFSRDDGSCHRTGYQYCELIRGTCDGYPHMWEECPIKDELRKDARDQLQKEGLL